MDESSAEPEASVKLTADVAPWEASLDKAAEKAKSWGDKVAGFLERSNNFKTDQLGRVSEFIEKLGWFDEENEPILDIDGLAKKLSTLDKGVASAEIGARIGVKLGSGIGSVLGSFLGPGIGTYLGGKFGESIGHAVFEKLLGSEMFAEFINNVNDLGVLVGKAADSFQPLVDGWGEIQRDSGDTFDAIRRHLEGLPTFNDLLNKNPGEIGQQLFAVFDNIRNEVDAFINRSLYRIQEAIDKIFLSIQEPAAKVLDYFQQTLTQIGLIEGGTKSWGDRLREVKDVGKQFIDYLALSFGVLEGYLINLSGLIVKYIAVPLFDAVREVTRELGWTIKNLSDAIPNAIKELIGSDAFKKLDEFSTKMTKFKGETQAARDSALAQAQKNIDHDPIESALKRLGEVDNRLAKGKDDVNAQRLAWAFADMFDQIEKEFMDWLNMPDAVKPGESQRQESFASTTKAVLAYSQQAANIIAQSQTGGGAPTLEKLAAFAKLQNAKQLEANTYLKEISESLKDLQAG